MKTPTTDPTLLYRTRDSIVAADALAAAIVHLDLFTTLDREPTDLAGLCRRHGLHPRPGNEFSRPLDLEVVLQHHGAGRQRVRARAGRDSEPSLDAHGSPLIGKLGRLPAH